MKFWALLVTTWISYSTSSWDCYPWIRRPSLQPVVRSGGVSAVSRTLSWRAEGTFYLYWSKHNLNFTQNSCHGHQFSSQKLVMKIVMHITKYTPCKVHQLYRVIQNDCRGTVVQRQFRTKFGKQPPSDNSIRRWYAQFQETGCVCIGGTEGTNQNRH